MAQHRVQSMRSNVAGARPAAGTRTPGELYTNWPDMAFGVIDNTQTPQDLLPIRKFSALASYAANDIVVNAGNIYVARAAVPPGAFNVSQWKTVTVGP